MNVQVWQGQNIMLIQLLLWLIEAALYITRFQVPAALGGDMVMVLGAWITVVQTDLILHTHMRLLIII